MSDAVETMTIREDITATALGSKFTRWGLGMFVLGFAVGFVPILHYMHGAIAGDVGPAFMKNMTLWWGCPAVLMEYTLKTGWPRHGHYRALLSPPATLWFSRANLRQ
jgi:hypothetical protein